jgi:hypothetical protein
MQEDSPNPPNGPTEREEPDSWQELMTTLADADPATRQALLAALKSHLKGKPASPDPRYRTQYHVHFIGGFRPGGHLLIIDHVIPVKLELAQWLLCLMLACHARTGAGLPTPIEIHGGIFLPPARISGLIRDLQKRERGLQDHPKDVSPSAMHLAKWDIRARLQRQGLDPDLLLGIRLAGYILSAPPNHISITLIEDNETNLIFD